MAIRSFYTPEEVAAHNSAGDLWVSVFHQVLNLTDLVREHRGELTVPLIEAAGQDISHWFDEKTGDVKTRVDPDKGIRLPYTPQGRFLHVPPAEPTADWSTKIASPWWQDEKLVIGKLSAKTRKIQIVNVISQQTDLLTVCSEETINEIRDRYMEYNRHAQSYTWKKLSQGTFVLLDMDKTLAENGVVDESEEFEELGIEDDFYYPIIHVYFNDDLTVA